MTKKSREELRCLVIEALREEKTLKTQNKKLNVAGKRGLMAYLKALGPNM